MKKLSLLHASRPLADYAKELRDEIVVLTKGPRAVAALVPLCNLDRESLALSTHPEFLEIVANSRREIASGKTLTLAAMRKRVLSGRASRKRPQVSAPKTRGG